MKEKIEYENKVKRKKVFRLLGIFLGIKQKQTKCLRVEKKKIKEKMRCQKQCLRERKEKLQVSKENKRGDNNKKCNTNERAREREESEERMTHKEQHILMREINTGIEERELEIKRESDAK